MSKLLHYNILNSYINYMLIQCVHMFEILRGTPKCIRQSLVWS